MELAVDNPTPEADDMDSWDLSRLNIRRDELLQLSRSGTDLTEDQLRELVRISHQMRRRSSGPPKEPKEKKTRVTKTAATLDELI